MKMKIFNFDEKRGATRRLRKAFNGHYGKGELFLVWGDIWGRPTKIVRCIYVGTEYDRPDWEKARLQHLKEVRESGVIDHYEVFWASDLQDPSCKYSWPSYLESKKWLEVKYFPTKSELKELFLKLVRSQVTPKVLGEVFPDEFEWPLEAGDKLFLGRRGMARGDIYVTATVLPSKRMAVLVQEDCSYPSNFCPGVMPTLDWQPDLGKWEGLINRDELLPLSPEEISFLKERGIEAGDD